MMTVSDNTTFWDARKRSPHSFSVRFRRMLWNIVQHTLFRFSPHTFNRWRSTLLRIFGARIGRACTIRRSSRIFYPWNLRMGDLSCLGDDAVLYNLGEMLIGNRVTISQEAYLCGGTHDYRQLTMPLLMEPIEVHDDAWICARAFVGPGVIVGAGAIVGAAAVVMKNVPPWMIVAGNPAKVVKERKMQESDEKQSSLPGVLPDHVV